MGNQGVEGKREPARFFLGVVVRSQLCTAVL